MTATTPETPPQAAADIPAGYRLLPPRSPFMGLVGPLYGRIDRGRPELAFRVEPRHANTMGTCHGGMLLAFADTAMSFEAIHALGGRRRGKTVAMDGIAFRAPGLVGDWIFARTVHDPAAIAANRKFVRAPVSIRLEDAATKLLFEARAEFVLPPEDDARFDLAEAFRPA